MIAVAGLTICALRDGAFNKGNEKSYSLLPC
jgi:hypothetical protein